MTVGIRMTVGRGCAVAPADEHAFQLLAFELVRDCAVLAHAISLASSASFATVFMLRAVPGFGRRNAQPRPARYPFRRNAT